MDTDPYNYYSSLNLSSDCTQEEIKSSFLYLSKIFHPDKFKNSGDDDSSEIFLRINKAYQVLGDPISRKAYHIRAIVYSNKNQIDSQDIVNTLTDKEIVMTYCSFKEQSILSTEIDISNLISRQNNLSGYANLNYVLMKCMYSFPHTTNVNSRLKWFAQIDRVNYNSYSCLTYSLSHKLYSIKELIHSFKLNPDSISYKVRAQFDKCSISFQFPTNFIYEFFDLEDFKNIKFKCYLSKSLKAQIGINIAMSKLLSLGILYAFPGNLVFETDVALVAHPQLIIPRINSTLSYHKSIDSRYSSSLSYNLLSGFEFSCSASEYQHDIYFKIGLLTGVIVRISKRLGSFSFSVPIRLSHDVSLASIGPFSIFGFMAYNVWEAYCCSHEYKRFYYKICNFFKKPNQLNNKLAFIRQKELMKTNATKNLEIETKINGLVIKKAYYGSRQAIIQRNFSNEKVIDVTIPLQCFVYRSTLKLSQYSKSSLLGFFDPCPGENKILTIEYEFNTLPYLVRIQDQACVVLPSTNHLIK